MGARAVLDMMLVDKVGDTGSFAKKLQQLEAQGFVGAKNREFLEAALDAGSAAAHRGHRPKQEDLTHAMDIIENILEGIYALEKAADDLKKTTPARSRQNNGT